MAGNRLTYYMVTKDDLYYVERGKWTAKPHAAAFMVQELAEQISRRYPGSNVEQDSGFDIFHKRTLEDVSEPDSKVYLEGALKLAVREMPKSEIEAIVRGVLDPAPEIVSSNHDNNFEVIQSLPGTLKELADRITKLEEQVGAGIGQ